MSLKEDVKAEIDNLPSLDEVKGEAPKKAPEPTEDEARTAPVESEQDNDASDEEASELPDFDLDDDIDIDDEGGDEEEIETETSATQDDDKRYSKKQLERKIEKRLKRERVKNERKIEEAVARKLQEAAKQYEAPIENEPKEGSNDISPQEYARQAIDSMEQQRKIAAQYQQKVEKGAKKYADYKDVVDNGIYSQAIVEAAEELDNEEDILYYLGKREDVAMELMQLSPAKQAAKVAKLSSKLTARQSKKRVSKAPEPLEKPKSSNSGYGSSYLDMLADSNVSFKELAESRKRKA